MKPKEGAQVSEMRSEYAFDYSNAVRGKYHKRLLKEGANVVVLDPDVAKVFRTSAAVNDALRGLLRSARRRDAVSVRSRDRARVRPPSSSSS